MSKKNFVILRKFFFYQFTLKNLLLFFTFFLEYSNISVRIDEYQIFVFKMSLWDRPSDLLNFKWTENLVKPIFKIIFGTMRREGRINII